MLVWREHSILYLHPSYPAPAPSFYSLWHMACWDILNNKILAWRYDWSSQLHTQLSSCEIKALKKFRPEWHLNPVQAWNLFSGFNFTTAQVVCVTAMINHIFRLVFCCSVYPNRPYARGCKRRVQGQFKYMIFHIFTCKILGCWSLPPKEGCVDVPSLSARCSLILGLHVTSSFPKIQN